MFVLFTTIFRRTHYHMYLAVYDKQPRDEKRIFLFFFSVPRAMFFKIEKKMLNVSRDWMTCDCRTEWEKATNQRTRKIANDLAIIKTKKKSNEKNNDATYTFCFFSSFVFYFLRKNTHTFIYCNNLFKTYHGWRVLFLRVLYFFRRRFVFLFCSPFFPRIFVEISQFAIALSCER